MLKQDRMWNRYGQGVDQRCVCRRLLQAAAFLKSACNLMEFPLGSCFLYQVQRLEVRLLLTAVSPGVPWVPYLRLFHLYLEDLEVLKPKSSRGLLWWPVKRPCVKSSSVPDICNSSYPSFLSFCLHLCPGKSLQKKVSREPKSWMWCLLRPVQRLDTMWNR